MGLDAAQMVPPPRPFARVVIGSRGVATERRHRARDSAMAEISAARRVKRVAVFVLSEVRLYYEGLAQLLSHTNALRIIGASSPCTESIAAIARAQPRAVLIDSGTVRRSDVVRKVSSAAPDTAVIAFAVAEDSADVLACAAAGASGFIARDASVTEVIAIVAGLGSGELPCSPRIATLMFQYATTMTRDRGGAVIPLTSREREIVALIGRGLSNKEIARALSIEVPTVKNHVHHLLEKLGVQRRWAAAAKVQSLDLVP